MDRGSGDAGEAGDREMSSDLAGGVSLGSVSFFVGELIFWLSPVLEGLLSPSGSGLKDLLSRTEQSAKREHFFFFLRKAN